MFCVLTKIGTAKVQKKFGSFKKVWRFERITGTRQSAKNVSPTQKRMIFGVLFVFFAKNTLSLHTSNTNQTKTNGYEKVYHLQPDGCGVGGL